MEVAGDVEGSEWGGSVGGDGLAGGAEEEQGEEVTDSHSALILTTCGV